MFQTILLLNIHLILIIICVLTETIVKINHNSEEPYEPELKKKNSTIKEMTANHRKTIVKIH